MDADVVVMSVVDWANVVAGIAGAIALVFTVWAFTRQVRQEARSQADKVIAWAVYVADERGGESDDLGVVIVNASTEVALDVDVKTCAAPAVGEVEDDGVPGRRFALIPPGTYFLPQTEGMWDAPVPVDTSDGKFVAAIPDPDGGAPTVLSLVPLTRRPEPKRVWFLRYRIAGEVWARGVDSTLRRTKDPRSEWDHQFTASQSEPLLLHSLKPHQANADVGSLIERLFQRFAVAEAASGPGAWAKVKPEFTATGITWVARTAQKGQGIRLGTGPGRAGEHVYLSGDYRGVVPNAGIQLTESVGAKGKRMAAALQPQPRDAGHWDSHLEDLVKALEKAVASTRPPTPAADEPAAVDGSGGP